MLDHSESVHRVSHGGVDDTNGASLDPATAVHSWNNFFGFRVLHAAMMRRDNIPLEIKGHTGHLHRFVANRLNQDVAL